MKKAFKNFGFVLLTILMLVVTMNSALATVTQDDLLDGLVSYWKFDETSGTVAVDSHGTNDGSISGATVNQVGKIGNSFLFYADDKVNLNTILVGATSDFSIGGWVKINDFTSTSDSFYNQWTSGTNGRFILRIQPSNNILSISLTGSDIVSWNGFTSATYDGVWTHIVYTRSGNTWKIYVDSDEKVTGTNSGSVQQRNGQFGSLFGHPDSDYNMDELFAYDRALNSTEITALYDIQKDGYTSGTYDFQALAETSDNFSVSVRDEWSNAVVNNITVIVNGETYTNTTGNTVTTNLLSNDTSTYLVQVSANDYLSRNYSDTIVSSNLNAELRQSQISFEALEIVTGNVPSREVISPDNFSDGFNDWDYSTDVIRSQEWSSVGDWSVKVTAEGGISANNRYLYKTINLDDVDTLIFDINITELSGDVNIIINDVKEGDIVFGGINLKSFSSTGLYLDNEIDIKNITGEKNIIFWAESGFGSGSDTIMYVDNIRYEETSFNITIDGTKKDESEIWGLSAGEYTALFESTDYYSMNHTFNVSTLDIETITINDVYNTIMKIELKDVITTDLIEETSYITVNDNAGYEHTYNNTNGSININLLQGNYSLTMWANKYAYRYENISINTTLFEESYLLYANNSIWITAIDSGTGASLSNFTIEIYNDDDLFVGGDDNTGTARLNNITSGVYTLRVIKDEYTTAEYVITMTGGSHQTLTAYLIQSETKTIFTVVNSISNNIIEGAQISMFQNLNGTWTLVSSRNTDITGRAQFTYTPNIEYRFIVDADDYVQRLFFLEPLFNTYTVRLDPELESIPDDNIGKWVYEISNKGTFYNNQNNVFSISLTSGTGTIEYFNLSITDHNLNTWSATCTDAIGCIYNRTIDIVDAGFVLDKIIVEYWMKETGRSEKYFKHVYSIQDIYGTNTLWGWKDVPDSDVGALEKGFLAMIITIITVGVASGVAVMVGAPPVTVSGFVLAGTVEIMALVGFIPSLSAHLIALGCVLIILFGRGEI